MPDAEQQAESFANPSPLSPAETQLALPGIYAIPQEIAMLFLDSSSQIERVKHNLAGETLHTEMGEDKVIRQFWKADGEKKMNDRGVRHIVSLLDVYINPNTATSNLSDDEIYNISRRAYKVLNQILRAKGEEYGVDNNHKATILNTITDMIFIELKKAKDGATLKAMTQSYQVRELKGYGGEKKGLQLSDLNPMNLIRR